MTTRYDAADAGAQAMLPTLPEGAVTTATSDRRADAIDLRQAADACSLEAVGFAIGRGERARAWRSPS